MANCMIGFPNRCDAATLSGGSWTAGLPRANLQNRILGKVARTSDAALASTKFDVDLGAAKSIQLVSLVNHNISIAGRYRVRATNVGAINQLLIYTEQFSNAAWTKVAATVTPDVKLAPDGNTTGDMIVEAASTSFHAIDCPLDAVIGTVYTFSVYAWAGTRSILQMLTSGDITSGSYANFDLSAGLVTASSGVVAVMTPLGGGLYRCSITFSAIVTVSGVVYLALQTNSVAARAASYAGDGASGLYGWGANVTPESSASIYYPATSAPNTRPGGYFDSWNPSLYDSGWTDVWPIVYPYGSLEWSDDNWWSGKYTAEQLSGYTTALVLILVASLVAQYWHIEIDDTANAAGYLQFGRLFIGTGWQPTINMSYGASIGWETKTDIQEALGGTEYFQRRTPYRVARFSLDWMTEDAGMANAFEVDRRAGVDQEVFWIHDTADTLHALRRQFLGRMRTLSPIEFPYFNVTKRPYEIKEIL